MFHLCGILVPHWALIAFFSTPSLVTLYLAALRGRGAWLLRPITLRRASRVKGRDRREGDRPTLSGVSASLPGTVPSGSFAGGTDFASEGSTVEQI